MGLGSGGEGQAVIPEEIIVFERVMRWLVEDGKLKLLSRRTCLACKLTMRLKDSHFHRCEGAR